MSARGDEVHVANGVAAAQPPMYRASNQLHNGSLVKQTESVMLCIRFARQLFQLLLHYTRPLQPRVPCTLTHCVLH